MYKCIVVGTDGSATGKRALNEALELSATLGAKLHVVSAYDRARGAKVVDAPKAAAAVWAVQPDTEARSIVEQAEAAARRRDVVAETHALRGEPADALLKVAERVDADLIVVGSRGMHGAGRVLGSVPNKVSHGARCSVLIVATEDQ